MRSKEITRRAAVTVRTLRHYHQIGLLPEPDRDANSYRHYTIRHLVRLLRIRRLSAIGLPLAKVAAVLDGTGEKRCDVLDQLDQSLVDQIEHLQQQRQIIAALREGTGPLDVSTDLTRALAPLEAGRSEEAKSTGQEQSVLLDSQLDEKGRSAVAALYARLAAPDLAKIVRDLGQRFDHLGPNTDETEITDLVGAYIHHLGAWMKEFNVIIERYAKADTNLMLWTHALEATTQQQHRLLMEIGSRLRNSNVSDGK